MDFLAILLLAVASLVVWRWQSRAAARERVERLEAGLADLAARVAGLETALGLPPLPRPAGQTPGQVPGGVAVGPQPDAPPGSVEPPTAPTGPQTGADAEAGGAVPPVARPEAAAEPAADGGGRSLEERLGAHWAVYVGGLALGLGGIFLVKYSIESGLITPAMRIALGAAFALALLGAGQLMHGGTPRQLAGMPAAAHIPSVLTAAGTLSAFATIYAAYALYGFLGPAWAFALLGATGLATMLLSARHGPALAALGLVGSYLTPLLVTSEAPSPTPLVLFLSIVAAAALLLARARGWLWLAATAVIGAVAWGLVMLSHPQAEAEGWLLAAMLHTLVQMVLAAGLVAVEPSLGTSDEEARIDWIAAGVLAALTVLVAAVLLRATTADAAWVLFTAITTAILTATALASAPAAAAAPLAGSVVVAASVLWPGLSQPAPESNLAPVIADLLRLPEFLTTYLWTALLGVAGVSVAAAWRLWHGRMLPVATAGLFALAATATPLLTLTVAYLRVTQFGNAVSFTAAGIALAAAFAYATEAFLRREKEDPTPAAALTTGVLAAATIAALSFTLVAFLSRGYLTVAFALAAAGAAYVSRVRDIPLLRHAVFALGLVVLGRLAWDPRVMGDDVGSLPLLNWLLLGYGVPAAAFAIAARLLADKGEDIAVRLSRALAVLLALLLCFFQIRHWVTGGDMVSARSGHLEVGLYTLTSLGFCHALQRLRAGGTNPVFRLGSLATGALALITGVVGLLLAENPMISGERVSGAPFVSTLLPAYLLPGLAALYVARLGRQLQPGPLVTAIAGFGLITIVAYASLEVRHLFQGEHLSASRATSSAELWGYTVAWLALAVLFLAYGLWRDSVPARLAAALLLGLTAIKIVAMDLSGVGGLWRALSFICLGGVLIGIGIAYQRLMANRMKAARPE